MLNSYKAIRARGEKGNPWDPKASPPRRSHEIITQILQEDTLEACLRNPDEPIRDKQDPATTAWNLTTAIFYKTRRRPWILTDPRPGVCYMGLVFKRLNKNQGGNYACCGA